MLTNSENQVIDTIPGIQNALSPEIVIISNTIIMQLVLMQTVQYW